MQKPSTLATPVALTDRPIIDAFPRSARANTTLLGQAGISDAIAWAKTPDELSDGQRARFDIASRMAADGQVVILDNFANGLDRLTAKAVAWSMQKFARKAGKTVIVLTPHDDLDNLLQADLIIRTRWQAEPELTWRDSFVVECPLLQELTYDRGTIHDWACLRDLHYAAGDPATTHSYHVLRHPAIRHPAAIAVLSWPDLHSAARNLATDDAYSIHGDRRQAMRLNREVLKLSRLVVAPELRCCSLTNLLIGNLIPTLNVRYLECVTAMGRYNNFLLRLGFKEVPQTAHPTEAALLEFIEAKVKNADVLMDHTLLEAEIAKLSVRDARAGRRFVWRYYHHFVVHRRTRKPFPKNIPAPTDDRWAEAFEIASKRAVDRPAYFVLGPLSNEPGVHGFPTTPQEKNSFPDRQLPVHDRIDNEPPSNHRSSDVNSAQPPHDSGTVHSFSRSTDYDRRFHPENDDLPQSAD